MKKRKDALGEPCLGRQLRNDPRRTWTHNRANQLCNQTKITLKQFQSNIHQTQTTLEGITVKRVVRSERTWDAFRRLENESIPSADCDWKHPEHNHCREVEWCNPSHYPKWLTHCVRIHVAAQQTTMLSDQIPSLPLRTVCDSRQGRNYLEICSMASPIVRLGIARACSTTSMPRNTSPIASTFVLPFSATITSAMRDLDTPLTQQVGIGGYGIRSGTHWLAIRRLCSLMRTRLRC